MSDLPKFESIEACPKCKGYRESGTVHVVYCIDQVLLDQKLIESITMGNPEEFMLIACKNCSYRWIEAPADAV